MCGTKRIVFALGPLGETRQPAALTQRADTVAAAGEDLVRIGLVADVPDQPVARRVEHIVQCYCQFDNAQSGAEVTAGDRDSVDGLATQFIGKPAELALLQLA